MYCKTFFRVILFKTCNQNSEVIFFKISQKIRKILKKTTSTQLFKNVTLKEMLQSMPFSNTELRVFYLQMKKTKEGVMDKIIIYLQKI